MKKILFNCSINNSGGGVKNAAIFIENIISYKSDHWYFAISKEVADLLKSMNIQLNEKFFIVNRSPAKSYAVRKQLRNLSNSLNVDLIYTMAGPAYVKFDKIHVMGISNPYLTHANYSDIFKFKKFKNLIVLFCKLLYQTYYLRFADYYIFQSVFSENQFSKKYPNTKNTIVIPNALDITRFTKFKKAHKAGSSNGKSGIIKIFVPGAYYDHKCFHLLVDYAKLLKSAGFENCQFQCTLKPEKFQKFIYKDAKKVGVEHLIANLGVISYVDILHHYAEADVVLVPSALETYSATYLEAQVMNKPLIVADRGFARDACGENAYYVDPFNISEVSKILLSYHTLEPAVVPPTVISQDQRCASIKSFIQKIFDDNSKH